MAPRAAHLDEFPLYTAREAAADRIVHFVGVPAAWVAVLWMVLREFPAARAQALAAIGIYGAGLIGMLTASAAYNLTAPGRAKAVLRRLDHAMIFVMIAGSYTPFALFVFSARLGASLLIAAWSIAALGVGLKLSFGHRYSRTFVLLYLAHGWMLLPVLGSLITAASPAVLTLLVAGGLVYSLGAVVHTREHWPFHNAVWHIMVLAAAGLHLAAIAQIVRA